MMAPSNAMGKGRIPTAIQLEFNVKWIRGAKPFSSKPIYGQIYSNSEVCVSWSSPRASGTLNAPQRPPPPAWFAKDRPMLEMLRDTVKPDNPVIRPMDSTFKSEWPGAELLRSIQTGKASRADRLKKEIQILKELSKPGTQAGGQKTTRSRSSLDDSRRQRSLPNLTEIDQSPATRRLQSSMGHDSEHLPEVRPTARTNKSRAISRQPDLFQKIERPATIEPTKSWETSVLDEKRAQEQQLANEINFRKANAKQQRKLLKMLRYRMHTKFKDTAFLPTNLWKSYRECDLNANGRIEFDEFSDICDKIGLGNEVLGQDGKVLLFQIADKDGSEAVDFNEFLQAVVGNLVKL